MHILDIIILDIHFLLLRQYGGSFIINYIKYKQSFPYKKLTNKHIANSNCSLIKVFHSEIRLDE